MTASGIQMLRKFLNKHYSNYYETSANICNQTVLSQPAPDNGLYCPALFDDWGICINHTKAGVTAILPCPAISLFNQNAMSFRHCQDNGTWQIIANGKPWTNISACSLNTSVDRHTAYHQSVSYLYLFIAGSCLSLLLVSISLAIFYGFRQLWCDRITIHKNLFLSYLFAAMAWIMYYRLVVLDPFVVFHNPVWCQLLHVIAHYFAATNYSWMFCEGLYLHIIMAHALRTGKKLIKGLIIGGWGTPFILTSVYAAIRATLLQEAHSCWIEEVSLQWIIGAPVAASVLINICILVNLVRLLMTKLKQIPHANESRKAAKATLILVPLFGLQFLIFPVRPYTDSMFYPVYLYCMSLLLSLQGSVASIIFCFCNGEVRALVRRKWHQHKLMSGSTPKNAGFTSSTFVDGYSVIDSTREGTCLKLKAAQDDQQNNIE